MRHLMKKPRLRIPAEDGSKISHALKDPDDFQGVRPRIVHHDVLWVTLHSPEPKRKIRQIFPDVPAQRSAGEKFTRLLDGRLNAVGSLHAVLGDVTPDFKEVIFRLRREAVEAHP
jgi:hypothetical protein